MASDRRDTQPTGSRFVGEIDHDEIKHIEVSRLFPPTILTKSLAFWCIPISLSFIGGRQGSFRDRL